MGRKYIGGNKGRETHKEDIIRERRKGENIRAYQHMSRDTKKAMKSTCISRDTFSQIGVQNFGYKTYILTEGELSNFEVSNFEVFYKSSHGYVMLEELKKILYI